MSGGAYNYDDIRSCETVFRYGVEPVYGFGSDDYGDYRRAARESNPLNDRLVSELVYDVFCLIHSYDWFICGDTSGDTYYPDLAFFKAKWLKITPSELVKREIDTSIDNLREELYRGFVNGSDKYGGGRR